MMHWGLGLYPDRNPKCYQYITPCLQPLCMSPEQAFQIVVHEVTPSRQCKTEAIVASHGWACAG